MHHLARRSRCTYAIETANMPARQAAYEDPKLREQFPADLLALWQDEHRHGGPAAGVPVLEHDRQRDAQQVAPGGLGEPGLDAAGVGRASSRTPSRGRCSCDPERAAEGATHDHRDRRRPARGARVRPLAGRGAARLEAGRAGRGDDARRHGLSDVPGALPVALPVPRDGAGRPGVHRARQLRHGPHRPALVAATCGTPW